MRLLDFYPLLKGLHVAFMVTWFAGLFYLPRLFIYHAEAEDQTSIDRFEIMERRLDGIMSIGAGLTLVFGLLLLWANSALLSQTWFQLKIVALIALFAYHERCKVLMRKLAAGWKPENTKGLRWFNEVPALLLLVIVLLAVIKPFPG